MTTTSLPDISQLAPHPQPPLSRLERWLLSPINFIGRLGIVVVSLTLWCTVALPVWLFLVLRAMAVLSFKNVANIYRGAGTVDVSRLEQVVVFWPRGFVAILRILAGDYDRGDLRPRHHLEAVQETLLAILFYTVMLFSAELARDYAWVVLKTRDWIIPHVQAGSGALLDLIRAHTGFPF